MRLVDQSAELLYAPEKPEQLIEVAGRTCYKSHDKISDGSAEKFVRKIVRSGHESVIEHMNVTVRLVLSRAIMAELRTHRLASYSVQSTRYVDFYKDDNGIEFIRPLWVRPELLGIYIAIEPDPEIFTPAEFEFLDACLESEYAYRALRIHGIAPQDARDTLNLALRTEMVMTANLREWRHIIKLRTGHGAHPMIRELMYMVLDLLRPCAPTVFEDIPGRSEVV